MLINKYISFIYELLKFFYLNLFHFNVLISFNIFEVI